MKRRVVITGMGTLNPLGNDIKTSWNAAKSGRSGIDFIRRYETDDIAIGYGGEIRDFDFLEYFGKKQLRRMDRFSQFALVAADQAIADSGIDFETMDRSRVGIYVSSGIGGLETMASELDKAREKGFHRVSPFWVPMVIINIAPGMIAIKYDLTGPALSTTTACASAANTMGEAFRAIRDGYLEVAITGGSEASMTKFGISGFSAMHALSKHPDPKKASRPFDLNRDGFVMADGAGCMMFETLEGALKRQARIYGEIVGYGATCDATHITAPDLEGTGAMNCMRLALEDGGVDPADIDHINAHGTSTPLNDKTETLAIKRLFKEHAYDIAINSTKSMTGHLLGGSGAIEAIFTLLALQEGFVPPTINYETPDPECDLDYTPNVGVEKDIRVALSNSLGFGGHNATLVFKKWEGR